LPDIDWINDGHTVALAITPGWVRLEWHCPHDAYDAKPLAGVTGDDLPYCRRFWIEDGERDPAAEPLDYCNPGEFITIDNVENCFAGALAIPNTNPFGVQYAWTGDAYLWRLADPAAAR
jgi:hypothetical protein